MVIVGSARSGTSWFSEIIALQHRYRLLFEPEHEFNTKQGKLICDRYLTESINTKDINSYLHNVFNNRVDCDWIAQLSNRKWKRHLWPIIPKKIIIKFVRCNLSASYMAAHFNIPVAFMVRNPYDVLASQKKVKFPWLYDLSWFQSQDELCSLIKKTYGYDLRKERQWSEFEKLSLRWCIENSVPFLSENLNFEVLYYETVKSDIQVYLNFCSKYRLEPLANIHSAFIRPSSKTHKTSEIIIGKTPKMKLSREEIEILNIYLDIFQIDFYEREH